MSSYLLLASGNALLRNGDVHYSFRADSDFLLWTGMNLENAYFLKDLDTDDNNGDILFFDEPTERQRIWEGISWDYEKIRTFGFQGEILPRDAHLKYLWEHKNNIYFIPSGSRFSEIEEKNKENIFEDASEILKKRRLFKTETDIKNINKAIEVTKLAFEYVREHIVPGKYEYEIEAEIAYIFRKYHLTEAYPTIVASGKNACTLHYTKHDRKIETGDLVLIDAGVEYMGFAADVTRTFFVGDVSERKKDVYRSVLAVKDYAESLFVPGIKKTDFEERVRVFMNNELKILNLIPSGATQEEEKVLSRKYFPHSVSHFLGIDVHDQGERDEVLLPHMVLTCEPGIYIEEEGIGIRIEDDIFLIKGVGKSLSGSIYIQNPEGFDIGKI